MEKIYARLVLWLVTPALRLAKARNNAGGVRALSLEEGAEIRRALCAMAARGDNTDEIARVRRALLGEFALLRGVEVSDPWITGRGAPANESR